MTCSTVAPPRPGVKWRSPRAAWLRYFMVIPVSAGPHHRSLVRGSANDAADPPRDSTWAPRAIPAAGQIFSLEPAVSRVLFRRCRRWWSFLWAGRCRTARATYSRSNRRGPRRRGFPRDPGLVLLRVGFAVPPPSPEGRCALTAPFHPYRPLARPAVCFLLHCPSSHLDWPLASTLPYGARTFLDGNLAAPPRPPVRLQREDARL